MELLCAMRVGRFQTGLFCWAAFEKAACLVVAALAGLSGCPGLSCLEETFSFLSV